MKHFFACLTLLVSSAAASAQTASTSFNDPLYGVAVNYPADWAMRGPMRWGKNNLENTIFFQLPVPAKSRPSLYFQPISNFNVPAPAPGLAEAHFRYTAGTKEQQRVFFGFADYRNIPETYHYKTINGRPAFSYTALFTSPRGELSFEYFTRVLGETNMAMFFVQGPIGEYDAMRRATDAMAATIHVP